MAHVELTRSRIPERFDDGADDHLECSAAYLPPPILPPITPTASLDMDTTSLASARVDNVYAHGQHDWMVDSGTTHSMTPYAANFISFTECRRAVKVAEGSTCHTKGYGDVILDIPGPDGLRSLKLTKVWLAPEMTSNLLSVSDLNQTGHIILFVGDQGHIYTDNANYRSETPLATAILRNKQYWLHTADTSKGQLEHLMRANQLTISTAASSAKSPAPISVDLAHRRACHAGERKVKHMPHHSTGITLIKGSLSRPCGLCV